MAPDPEQSLPPAIVQLDAVQKVFPNGTRALDPVSLTIREGEFVTLVGPSGCGKSTLLRLVAGLTAPSAGRVQLSETARARGVGFVFQSPTLMPWASVERNVRLPLALSGRRGADADAKVDRALALVGLQEFRHAYPRELSGGMQMRASIARALVDSPRLLLLDEPFGALDEITRNRLDQDLASLSRRENLTVLFVTHSIYEAAFLSSRVLVMSARPGRICADMAMDHGGERDDAFRSTGAFARTTVRLSDALAAAMAQGAHA